MDQDGLTTLQMSKQHEAKINIEKGELKIQTEIIFIQWSNWS